MLLSESSILELGKRIELEISACSSSEECEEIRVRSLGKKGEFTALLKDLASLSPEEKRTLGGLLNQIKTGLELSIDQRKGELLRAETDARLTSERIDVTLPVRAPLLLNLPGSLHPLICVQRELEEVFRGLGFTVVDGPEVEREYYNFEALNIPASHPARDMQDTFWTTAGDLLRTHTSTMQVRSLERIPPPLRIVAPGRVFRYERSDATHGHTFFQMEGMMIDRHVSIGHLLYFMRTLLREIFGSEQKIRLRPGYFPFVEPGFELDIWFQGRWMELLPCGLVHPEVLRSTGIDPNEWQGFAFGLGLSRLVMSRYQIDDIRHLESGELRFLRQFS